MRPCLPDSGRRLAAVNDASRRPSRSPACLREAEASLRRRQTAISDRGFADGFQNTQAGTKKRPLRPSQETTLSGWLPEDQSVTPQGASRSDGNMVRTWVGTLRNVIAPLSASRCLEPDPRYPSWPAVQIRPHQQAEYMTAPDRNADTAICTLPKGGRPYMTAQAIRSR